MAEVKRYGKPSLTNLPTELGVRIFKTIMNSSPPDEEAINAESDRLMTQFLEARERERAQKRSSAS